MDNFVGAGVWNPDATDGFPDGDAFAGQNVGFGISHFNRDVGLSQVLTDTLQADTQYVLGAQIGNPIYQRSDDTANYRLELLAGGVLLDIDTGAPPASGMWEHHSLTYDSGANPAQLGEPLEIRLIAVRYSEGGGPDRREVEFDEVTLSAILEPTTTILDLDIKPGPSNNTVALNGNGTLRMAILANEEFDVLEINIDSLLFGDPILIDGGATPLGATSDRLRDLNHDGLDD